jgi:multiple sugar transport system substrate-binding protein
MPDVIYSGIKWFHYSAFKGAFLALDDLVKADDPGMKDLFTDAIEGSKLDGKLYAIPHEVNPGNQNTVLYNKNILDEKGVKHPTDDWTLEDYATMSAKLTDKDKKIFGTNYLTTNYYDFATLTRSYGAEILSEDGKTFTFASEPKVMEAMRWEVDLRAKHKAAPLREESQGIAFPSGQIALLATGNYDILAQSKTVGDKFKWDVVLGPKGPNGLRGYEVFLVMFSLYAKTKVPKEAYDLLKYESSKETAMYAFLEQGQPPARISVWSSPEAQKMNSYWGRAATWLTSGKDKGVFPLPYNLRFQEFQDKWANLSTPVFYGEVGFDEGVKKIQEECQAIVALPRG